MESIISHIRELFKKILPVKRVPLGKEEGIHLKRDWESFLIGLLLLSLLAIIFGMYTFYDLGHNIQEDPATLNSKQNSLNREKLDSVIEVYEQRRVEFDALRSNGVTIPTP